MIWLYAITDTPEAQLPRVAGHGGQSLAQTCVGRLAGVWSDCPQMPPTASAEEALWRQEAVLEALMEHRTVLPVRYGMVLEGGDVLRRMISSRQAQWLEALGRVCGCVEMAVRAEAPAPSVPAAGDGESGTQYLNRRALERAGVRELTGAVHDRLAMASRASEVSTSAGTAAQLTASYLVPRSALEQFKCAVVELSETEQGLGIVCTGPWPPYSFVQATGTAA